MTRDYEVTIKVRNNRMLAKMREAGFESALSLAKACGIGQSTIGAFLNMKQAPIVYQGHKKEKWSSSVVTISESLKCLPEDMFPPAQLRKPMEKNSSSFTVDAVDIHQISASLRSIALPADQKMLAVESKNCLSAMLNELTSRERDIIEKRFGLIEGKERTLRSVGDDHGVQQERVRQIEMQALRKLQNLARDKTIAGALRGGLA